MGVACALFAIGVAWANPTTGVGQVAAGQTASDCHGLGVDVSNNGTGMGNYLITSYHVSGAFDVLTVTLPPNTGKVTISVKATAAADLKLVVIAPGGNTVIINNPGNVQYSQSVVNSGVSGGSTVTVSGPGSGSVDNNGATTNTVTFAGAPGWTQNL